MSHLPERKEKICLNCGAALHGRFCHYCGQENIEPKDSFWHLVTHFVYDVIHFDGKFFSTLKYLLFRPGFLSHEYLRGRRADYLHPIRMYVFTSAFFFLIFFGFYQTEKIVAVTETKDTAEKVMSRLERQKGKLEVALANAKNGVTAEQIRDRLKKTESDIVLLKGDSTKLDSVQSLPKGGFSMMSFDDKKINTTLSSVREYDSLQAALPESERDGFFVRAIERQNVHLREKYKGDSKASLQAITNKFIHLFPQMLFVSLPLFALILQAMYARRRQFYYVNHVIYSIHLYCATFIIILSGLWVDSIVKKITHEEYSIIGTVFTLSGFFYLYKSMRNFYQQRRAKTILKYILLLLASLFVIGLLFLIFFLLSAFVV